MILKKNWLKEEMYDDNNIFAKIIRKEISSSIVYEDEKVLFFHDIIPQAKIHILAIPKIPVRDFTDFLNKSDEVSVKYFFDKINEVVKNIGLNKAGFRLVTNNGLDANQEVPHFHIHILGGENLSSIR